MPPKKRKHAKTAHATAAAATPAAATAAAASAAADDEDGGGDEKGGDSKDDGDERPAKRRATFEVALRKVPQYFSAPVYGDMLSNGYGGGTSVTAVISPTVVGRSAAVPTLPRAIVQARKRWPTASFKAGHILNMVCGGPGNESKNLTILSASGNGANKKFDNRIQDARAELEAIYKLVHKHGGEIANLKLGVKVEVKVSDDKWGNEPPDSFICQRLHCSADVHPDTCDSWDAFVDELTSGGNPVLRAEEMRKVRAAMEAAGDLKSKFESLLGLIATANHNGNIANKKPAEAPVRLVAGHAPAQKVGGRRRGK